MPASAVPALVLGLTALLVLAYRRLGAFRAWIDALDVRGLVLLHVTRFVGFYFLVLYDRGALPYAFAVPGGIGDIAVAALALAVCLFPWGEASRRRAISIWNIVGLIELLLTILTDILGVSVGSVMGYYGGKFDLFFQRIIEIWQALPALFVIIIISSIIYPNFFMLVALLVFFGWTGMTYFMRGEFYREKAKDYVSAAISLGATDSQIIFKHILPNSLTPIIASFPFALIGGISSLVSLDYLGFGLPPPTPSWGQMVDVGLKNFSGNFQNWWLVLSRISAMFLTLMLVTFIGEGIREAFDPKVFSRLR